MADSRMTFTLPSGNRTFDAYIKTQSLGGNAAIVLAGHSAIANLVVEGVRPMIAALERNLERDAPLLAQANLVWAHLDLLFPKYLEIFGDANVALIAAGRFSDRTFGLVRMTQTRDTKEFSVFRPQAGDCIYAAIGDENWIPTLCEAARRSRPPEGRSINDVASVLWDIIKHEGRPAETIGGGISIGFMNGSDAEFQWPQIDIEGNVFLRGVRYPPVPGWPAPLQIEYDDTLLSLLEREDAETPFSYGVRPTVGMYLMHQEWRGDPRVFNVLDDQWLLGL